MKLTLNQAAKECGRAKSTISKALKSGKLSYVEKTDAGYRIDPAELFRVFPPQKPSDHSLPVGNPPKSEQKTSVATIEMAIELGQLRAETEHLRQEAATLRSERDDWKQQAQTLLLERPIKAEKTPVGWFDRLLGR